MAALIWARKAVATVDAALMGGAPTLQAATVHDLLAGLLSLPGASHSCADADMEGNVGQDMRIAFSSANQAYHVPLWELLKPSIALMVQIETIKLECTKCPKPPPPPPMTMSERAAAAAKKCVCCSTAALLPWSQPC